MLNRLAEVYILYYLSIAPLLKDPWTMDRGSRADYVLKPSSVTVYTINHPPGLQDHSTAWRIPSFCSRACGSMATN